VFRYLRRPTKTVASEVDEELAVHLEMRVDELIGRGFPPDEARREAIRQFGDVEFTRQYCRTQDLRKEGDVQRGLFFEELVQDLRISLRGLLRAPLMTLTIVLTVGLGIGATTTIFGAVYAALLRHLPYERPEQLVRIYTDAPPNKFRFSVVDYLALQAEQTHFAQVAGYTGRQMAFSDGAVAERINGKEVSWTYFSLLGIKPAVGGDFAEVDGRAGGPRRVIVSDGFWRRRLGGRVDAIGRSIRLDGTDFTLAGVLPSATGPLERDLEFFTAAQWAAPQRKGPFFIIAIGRLRDGATRAAATEELHAITRRLFPVWRSSYQDERATWGLMDLQTYIVGDVSTVAGLALAAVGLVWLIACANASNLLIARVTGRRRELAVRAALGASRGRVVRYLLAESALLALGAGALGIGLASIGTRLWRDLAVDYFPRAREIALDGPALAVLAALTGISILLFGLVPAAQGSGGSLGFAGGDDPLRSMGRAATASRTMRRMRRVLVGSQFAIATPLLIVAGLFLATLSELGRVDLGFDTHNLASGSITLPAPQYGEAGRARAFWTEVQRRVEALPGVSAVAFADGRPPNDVGNFNNFDLEDLPARPGQSQPVTPWVAVTPEYFRLLGLSLLEGRLLEERDGIGDDILAVVVDRAWAKRFFPNQSAIGKRFRSGGCTTCPWTSVVGVVTEVKYAGLDKPDAGSVYTALPPDERERYLFVRSAVDPATVMPAVRQILRELDPALPFSQVATMEELTADALQTPRSLAWLVGVLAAVALLLSVIGIYGVMAYYVQQHAKDISIRLALGANPGGVVKLVVGQGMAVVAGGVAVGAVAAFAATRLIAALLFRVSAADPRTFAAVAALLSFVGLVACLVPARRATALEPASVLRND
jgi:putative ABC transport system permease protein